jgi:TPR repeat protein
MKFLPSLVVCCFAAASCLNPVQAGDWEDAQAAFSEYDDANGLRLLERAAHQGDLRAMQAWGMALLHGPKLFATLNKADPKQAVRWLDQVAQRRGPNTPGRVAGSSLP